MRLGRIIIITIIITMIIVILVIKNHHWRQPCDLEESFRLISSQGRCRSATVAIHQVQIKKLVKILNLYQFVISDHGPDIREITPYADVRSSPQAVQAIWQVFKDYLPPGQVDHLLSYRRVLPCSVDIRLCVRILNFIFPPRISSYYFKLLGNPRSINRRLD